MAVDTQERGINRAFLRINIHDITVERPVGRTVDFYLERDVYDSDWRGLEGEFEHIRSTGPYDNRYLNIALGLKVLRPEILAQFKFLELDVGQVKKCIRLERDYHSALDDKAKAMLIFPEYGNFDIFAARSSMTSEIEKVQELFARAVGDPRGGVEDRRTQEFIFNEIKDGDEELFIKCYGLALLRIATFDLGFDYETGEYIDDCKNQLRIARFNKDWVRFAQNLFSLAVLTAKDVRLDEDGLHLRFSPTLPKHDQTIIELPQVRKF